MNRADAQRAWDRAQARAAAHRAELAKAHERGALYAHHWVAAQRLLEGCPQPPTDRSYVALAKAIAGGAKGDHSAGERSALESFWSWYMLAETHVLRLVEALDYCQAEEHRDLGAPLLSHAHALQHDFDRWLAFGHWLPARPPRGRTLQQVLRDAIARYG